MGGLRRQDADHVCLHGWLAGVGRYCALWPASGRKMKSWPMPATHNVYIHYFDHAAVCTAFYMGRQLLMVFFGKPRTKRPNMRMKARR